MNIITKVKIMIVFSVKQDVLCTVFSYARYCKAMEEMSGFSGKILYQHLD